MKSVLVLLVLVSVVDCLSGRNSTVRYLVYEHPKGQYVVEDLNATTPALNVSKSDITLYFYSRENREAPILTNHGNYSIAFNNGFFDSTKDTVFLIHGWRSNGVGSFSNIVKNAELTARDVNVFSVDWRNFSEGFYLTARGSVPEIGENLGELIQDLVGAHDLDLSKTFLVGHSLGAHIAGIAGQILGGKVSAIVGLDPAFPLIFHDDLNRRLDPSDAKFVEVIHTTAGLLGIPYKLGHADYYPDGGVKHPSCSLDVLGECSHRRSYDFYAESVLSGNFTAYKCENYDAFNQKNCSSVSYMGEYNLDRSAFGVYYLNTSARSPYAQGDILYLNSTL